MCTQTDLYMGTLCEQKLTGVLLTAMFLEICCSCTRSATSLAPPMGKWEWMCGWWRCSKWSFQKPAWFRQRYLRNVDNICRLGGLCRKSIPGARKGGGGGC